MIASRAENETISSAADVFCEFGADIAADSRAECGSDEFGAGNGDFSRAELCNGAFWADMVTDSRAGGYISLFQASLAPFSRAECGADEFRADIVADSCAEGMALVMQKLQELQELQVQDFSANQLIWE